MSIFYFKNSFDVFSKETWQIKDNDPLGTDAIQGGISRIKCNVYYSLTHILELLLGKLAWYMYVVRILLYISFYILELYHE
jgi:hypothetical protein